MKKIYFYNLLFILCFLWGSDPISAKETEPITIEVYVNNACASCDPYAEFYEWFQTALGDERKAYSYEIREYNIFHLTDRERFSDLCEKFKTSISECPMPSVYVGGILLSGEEEIKNGMREAFLRADSKEQQKTDDFSDTLKGFEEDKKTEALIKELEEISKDTSFLLLFTTYSCRYCEEAKEFLSKLPKVIEVEDENGNMIESLVEIREVNLMEEGSEFLFQLFAQNHVPEQQQQVPILFYSDGYLSGPEQIKTETEKILSEGKALSFSYRWKADKKERSFGWQEWIGLFLTGLLNGLNPCGISMLLMLLSVTIVSGKLSVKKIGFSYLGGKYFAYFGMGLFIYQIVSVAEQNIFLKLNGWISKCFGFVAIVLACFYLMDFFYARNQEYGKIRMQLPQKLRRLDHELIKRLSSVSQKKLIFVTFFTGILLSAGEFFCTGQIYLAAILYLIQTTDIWNVRLILAFVLYVTALCIPSVLFVSVIQKTKNIIIASDFAMKHMAIGKLLSAFFFFLFGLFLVLGA